MKNFSSLPQAKKLAVLVRVEPGCLGPEGIEKIDSFCDYAQQKFEQVDASFISWDISPRRDKNVPELQYQINSKNLSSKKAALYLAYFDKRVTEFEDHFHEELDDAIEQYLGR